jgi:hypothetical protein
MQSKPRIHDSAVMGCSYARRIAKRFCWHPAFSCLLRWRRSLDSPRNRQFQRRKDDCACSIVTILNSKQCASQQNTRFPKGTTIIAKSSQKRDAPGLVVAYGNLKKTNDIPATAVKVHKHPISDRRS